MSFRVFCVSGIVLLVVGYVVAPAPSAGTPRKIPAPPKRYDQSQEDYAKQILGDKDISELNPVLLPKPDVNIHKYILTDDTRTVEGFLKHGNFVPKFAETWVWKIEDQTAFRLTVQDHYNNLMYCVQRIRIYEELETPQEMAKRLATNPNQEKQSNVEGTVPFKKASTESTDEKLGKVQSSLEGKASVRGQSSFEGKYSSSKQPTLEGQASSRNQSPVEGQASSRKQPPLGGQASSRNQSPLEGQASARNQPPLEKKSSAREASSAAIPLDTRSTARQRPQNRKQKTPRRKFKDTPREDILAKCEGGFEMRPHTRYRFGFADTIFFYGANRIIYKIQDPNLVKEGGFICHERSYTVGGRRDKVLTEQQCNTKLDTIFAWQGTMKNLIWNLFHHPMSFISGRAFREK